jgi:hypothetical protein
VFVALTDIPLAVDLLELAVSADDDICTAFKSEANTWPQDFRLTFQQRLADKFKYEGVIDGRFGKGSLAAVDAMCGSGG